MTVSQQMPQPSITEISFEIGYIQFYSDLPGANELMGPLGSSKHSSILDHFGKIYFIAVQ